jgi:trigger factor
MQVTETKSEGLSHEFKIIVPPEDIEVKTNAKLHELAGEVTIPGFRPGKVPPSVIRQRYGQAVRGEVLEIVVGEAMASALSERNLQPAMQPKVEVQKFEDGGELEFTVAVDVLPEIDPVDFKSIEVERLKVAVGAEQVDKSIEQMATEMAQSEPIKGKRKSKAGDIVVIDFEGKVDGELFEGGTAKDFQLTLGSNQFVPGFEDQLTGVPAGDDVTVNVTMPADYQAENLAGKDVIFACTVKEIREKKEAEINDEFAKNLGMDSLAALKDQIKERMESEYLSVCRERMKRELLDKLDSVHSFEVPAGMLDAEFDSIWQQYLQAQKDQPEDTDDEVEEPEKFYRGVAERRVRLGLLLAAVGQRNNIEVSPEELNRALIGEAQRYPGQEQKIIEMYQENQQAMANLRAPLFEDKVVDFIVEMAQVNEREVTLEELTKEMVADQKAAEEKSKPKKKAGAKKKAAPKKKAAATKKPAAEKKADQAADSADEKGEK